MKIFSIVNKNPSKSDSKSCWAWLKGKRQVDNAEGLWRIHDKLYDLSSFIKKHPGGKDWLVRTKGTDITESFETHHIAPKASLLLPSFYVRDAIMPRNYKFTYDDDGFYRTLKRKVNIHLKNLDMKKPIELSKTYSDVCLIAFFSSAIMSVKMNSYTIGFISAVLLMFQTIIGHNFIHKVNNWRMYTVNLSLMSWRDWRVFHVFSHHGYPNSYHDMLVNGSEPMLKWIPYESKTKQSIVLSWILAPLVFVSYFIGTLLSRFFVILNAKQKFYIWEEMIALTPPIAMFLVGSFNIVEVLKMWIFILTVSSLLYGFVSTSDGHHYTSTIHERDEIQSLDFGMFQLRATMERTEANMNSFLRLAFFGEHTLHHMFPTLDHLVLPQLRDILIETCKEFNISIREMRWHELIIPQFQQLGRTKKILYSKVK
ncbi:unnamed protein product [Diamesa serratosioi]